MKKMPSKLRKIPMRQQMMISFAVPLTIIYTVVFFLLYPWISRSYQTTIGTNYTNSCTQTASTMNGTFQNMADVANLVANDKNILSILGKNNYLTDTSDRRQYENFVTLKSSLDSISSAFSSYRVSIFIPDSIPYSINYNCLYPFSELKSQPDYNHFISQVLSGSSWLSHGHRKTSYFGFTSSPPAEYDAISLYLAINADVTYPNEFTQKPVSGSSIVQVSISSLDIKKILQNSLNSSGYLALILDHSDNVILSSLESDSLDFQRLADASNDHPIAKINGKTYCLYGFSALSYCDWNLIIAIPIEELSKAMQIFTLFITLILALVIVSNFFCSYILAGYYASRLVKISSEMKALEGGNLNSRLPDTSVSSKDEIDQIYYGYNYMADRMLKMMQDQYKMGKSVKSAELRALQAQINPHFLYNTLDLINWMAMDYGETEIAEIAQNLARFYRLSLNHGRNVLTIGEELDHVQAYVNIENFHFVGAICLNIHTENDTNLLGCPNIILQPFVENAIVHGIGEIQEIKSCNIEIRISKIHGGKDILFTISDDGPGMKPNLIYELEHAELSQATRGYGIKNIIFRIKLYFGENYGVHYSSDGRSGTTAQITIPAMQPEDMEKLII